MDNGLVQAADRHDLHADDTVFAVQVQGDEVLFAFLLQVRELLEDVSRRGKPLMGVFFRQVADGQGLEYRPDDPKPQ